MNHTMEGRVMNLLDPETQILHNVSYEEAIRRVAGGDAREVGAIEGSFALVGVDGIKVRMARTLDRPMRFFLAKKADGPILLVADRIARIKEELGSLGIDDQFHPSYTRMVPAHYVMEVELRGCPDPFPRWERFFAPERGNLGPDEAVLSRLYVGALAREIGAHIERLPKEEPIGVLFSGGIDSGSILLLAHHVLSESGMNPCRLKAFTLAVEGHGGDLAQARDFLERTGLALYHEPIEVPTGALDIRRAVAVIEDYKPLDVECATAGLALLTGIRRRYPDWKHILDGDGGDENLKDYPIEENSELTIRSVLLNPLLYQEGWGVGNMKHSLTYSGGQSRSYVRTYAPARLLGFRGFSPYTRREVIRVAEGIPFIELTGWSHRELYALKGRIVSRGVTELTGIEMPVFEKRRFQHGAMEQGKFSEVFARSESEYRCIFTHVS